MTKKEKLIEDYSDKILGLIDERDDFTRSDCEFGIVVNNPDVGRFLPKGDGYTGKIDWNHKRPNAVCVN